MNRRSLSMTAQFLTVASLITGIALGTPVFAQQETQDATQKSNVQTSEKDQAADINALEYNDFFQGNVTPLMKAVFFQKVDEVKSLLENGADPNIAGVGGNTALFFVTLNKSSFDKYADLAKLLLDHGANPAITNDFKMTPLMVAVFDPHVTQLLIDSGADVNARDSKGNTPVMYAANDSHLESVHILLSNGANPNVWNVGQITPLMLACLDGYPAVVTELLASGAAMDVKNTEGKTARDMIADILNEPLSPGSWLPPTYQEIANMLDQRIEKRQAPAPATLEPS